MIEALRIVAGSNALAVMWMSLLVAIVVFVLGWRQQRFTQRQEAFDREEKRASRAVSVIPHK